MELSFENRVAIVTGAGAGLGLEHALLLAERGAAVVINDIVDPEQAVAAVRARGGEATADDHSIVTPEGGEAVVATALDRYGRVDIVVNNAGIVRDKTFAKMTAELLDPVLDVHLKGAFNVTVPAYRYMREHGYGRIVSTTSAAGLFGNFGQTNYGAAKAGLVGMTKVLALESFKYGIRANVVAPIAATAMSAGILDAEWERRLQPRLVAPAVAWLAHEDCPVTGEILAAAAGRVARIFIAETAGIYSPELTVEDIRDGWTEIVSEEGYAVPVGAEGERDLFSAAFARAEGSDVVPLS
jgi:NAD(P)-dependent dehydrogenase (short-subunit alcohol dehydrogenase family)